MTDILRPYQSVVKQNKDVGAYRTYDFFNLDWQRNEWIFAACPRTIGNNAKMYVLFEFDETKKPKIGLASICVTEEEMNSYFYEDRKVDLN